MSFYNASPVGPYNGNGYTSYSSLKELTDAPDDRMYGNVVRRSSVDPFSTSLFSGPDPFGVHSDPSYSLGRSSGGSFSMGSTSRSRMPSGGSFNMGSSGRSRLPSSGAINMAAGGPSSMSSGGSFNMGSGGRSRMPSSSSVDLAPRGSCSHFNPSNPDSIWSRVANHKQERGTSSRVANYKQEREASESRRPSGFSHMTGDELSSEYDGQIAPWNLAGTDSRDFSGALVDACTIHVPRRYSLSDNEQENNFDVATEVPTDDESDTETERSFHHSARHVDERRFTTPLHSERARTPASAPVYVGHPYTYERQSTPGPVIPSPRRSARIPRPSRAKLDSEASPVEKESKRKRTGVAPSQASITKKMALYGEAGKPHAAKLSPQSKPASQAPPAAPSVHRMSTRAKGTAYVAHRV